MSEPNEPVEQSEIAEAPAPEAVEAATPDVTEAATTEVTEAATTEVTEAAPTEVTEAATTEVTEAAPTEVTEAAPTEVTEAATEDAVETAAPEETDASIEPPEPSGEEPAEFAVEQLGIHARPEAGVAEEARFRAILEAVVYITDEPLSAKQIAEALGQPLDRVIRGLTELLEIYARPDRGLSIREVAGGFKMSTKAEFHEEIRSFVKKLKPPMKLSLPALETLAVIAYKQPITGPEIMEIRGVQGGGVLKTLLDRKLITASGRKQVVGRPVLYKTTKDFLVQFGLKDIAELPSIKEFEELSRLALGDSEEPEAAPAPGAANPSAPSEPPAPQPEQPAVEIEAGSESAAQAEPAPDLEPPAPTAVEA